MYLAVSGSKNAYLCMRLLYVFHCLWYFDVMLTVFQYTLLSRICVTYQVSSPDYSWVPHLTPPPSPSCPVGVTAVEPEWLATLCPGQCTFSKPLEDPPPEFDPVSGRIRCHMTANFGTYRIDIFPPVLVGWNRSFSVRSITEPLFSVRYPVLFVRHILTILLRYRGHALALSFSSLLNIYSVGITM